ncbi:MAG TPA: cytochrome b/b6 domain-containing protein [Flavobacteriales bacterium]|nr:cytochrome b/b6 domain-containing protein [Flavobacteriales bacterium]
MDPEGIGTRSGKFTFLHRLLHWVMAIAMSVLFITGFLRMYWMNKHQITGIIGEKAGDVLPKEVMADIATAIRAPMWEWHVVFAHVMIFAFVARIIYMLAKGIRFPNPFGKDMPLKKRFQGLTYVYFYAFVLMSVVTGICLRQGFLPGWKTDMEAVHKWGIWWFPLFIVLHAAGVLLAEHAHQRGITSRMIGGDGPATKE